MTYAQNAWVVPPHAGGPVRVVRVARESDGADGGSGDGVGEVTTPGGVIVYDDLYGNVYLGR